ncbi:uncharacterized protein C2orf81 homolog [Takifugu flavidus]|uniref:Uncharacterized protein n=1 Tax=Takifugu flavidus TaxID=433684 RepID=A0A5C6N2U0_9TELE|nr:uncharacterized protein C2orf81 homolog [Takifugu flavidus]XP_056889381.1 uncharacterized protein C2orf81 homolog [Takifugu flavidus]TWW60027.1 hypothetical protein D4764_05G0001170 [Takifugu flavidus]
MPRSSKKPAAEKREQKSPGRVTVEPKVTEEPSAPRDSDNMLWNDVLGHEEADEIVGALKEELHDVMDGCLNARAEQQLSAFSTLWAKNYLTEMVEGHILCLDRGVEPEEACRSEDSEAVPVASDPWLQGCQAVVNATPQQQAPPKQVTDITPTKEQKPRKSTAKQQRKADVELASSSPQQRKKETSLSSAARSSHPKVLYPPLKLKKQKMNLSTAPAPGQLLPPIAAAADREDVEVKREDKTLLAPDSTTGSVRQLKSRYPIPKLDPSLLPQHQVLLQHMVSDSIAAKCQKSSRRPSQLAKEEAVSKHQTEMMASSSELSGLFLKRDEPELRLSNLCSPTVEGSRDRMPPSGPLRLDNMKLAEGVSLLDPPADDRMHLQSDLPGLSTDLKPILSDAAVPLYSLEQVIAGPPQVTPVQTQN